MRKTLGAAGAAAALLLVFACSSSSSKPPVEGCAGACGGGGGGGGGSSGSGSSSGSTSDDGGPTNCGVASNASQCDLCVATSCCTQLQGCIGDTACEGLRSCVAACGGGATCINKCEQSNPSASLYESLSTCEQGHCVPTPCGQAGAGDPCGSFSYPCASNVSCNGLWCTRTCTKDTDCGGIGPNGGNYLGFPNACIHTSAGNTCAPGCNVPQDCSGFAGTTCIVGTDIAGGNVFVCGSISDAAAE